MSAFKRTAILLAILLLGLLALYHGYADLRDSRRLQADGIATMASVSQSRIEPGLLFGHRTCLTITFKTADGQIVAGEVEVKGEVHRRGRDAGSVPVHYLPSDPEVFQVGEVVRTKFGLLCMGLLFLGLCLPMAFTFNHPVTSTEIADSAADHVESLPESDQDFLPIHGGRFFWLDQRFYDDTRRWFEDQGFLFLGDANVSGKQHVNPDRTFLRILVSPDRTQVVTLCHLKPSWFMRLLGARESRVCCIDTEYSDHSFVSTDNAVDDVLRFPSPIINQLHLPSGCSPRVVLSSHELRLREQAGQRPGLFPIQLRTLEDVYRSIRTQQNLKAALAKLRRSRKQAAGTGH